MWRPVEAGFGSKQEVFHQWTLCDVWDANEILNARAYAEWKATQK